jgi:hypothetical protein
VTAWVGSLLAIGYIAAPLLFARLADRGVAGNLAGDMFAYVAWVGLACGTYLMLYVCLLVKGWRALPVRRVLDRAADAGPAAAGHFGVQPILAQLKADALPRQVMESACGPLRDLARGVERALPGANPAGYRAGVLQERGKGR